MNSIQERVQSSVLPTNGCGSQTDYLLKREDTNGRWQHLLMRKDFHLAMQFHIIV